jgi:hypothetical protein
LKTRTAKETTSGKFFFTARTFFTEQLPSNDWGIHRQTSRISLCDTNVLETSRTILLFLRVFVAARTCLSSHSLAEYTHTYSDWRHL